jgi:hypothetical protein
MHALLIAWLASHGIELVELHDPVGGRLYINPEVVTSVRELAAGDSRHFPQRTHCVIVMVNGKFLGVIETCDEVLRLIQRHHIGADER